MAATLLLLASASVFSAFRAWRIVLRNLAAGAVTDRKGPPILLWSLLIMMPVGYLKSRRFLEGMVVYGRPAAVFVALMFVAVGVLGSALGSGPSELRVVSALFAISGPLMAVPGPFAIAAAVRKAGGLPPATSNQDW